MQSVGLVGPAAGPSGKPVVTITASAAASVTAAAKASLNQSAENVQIYDAVNEVLGGYDWALVPVTVKYVILNICRFRFYRRYFIYLFLISALAWKIKSH